MHKSKNPGLQGLGYRGIRICANSKIQESDLYYTHNVCAYVNMFGVELHMPLIYFISPNRVYLCKGLSGTCKETEVSCAADFSGEKRVLGCLVPRPNKAKVPRPNKTLDRKSKGTRNIIDNVATDGHVSVFPDGIGVTL